VRAAFLIAAALGALAAGDAFAGPPALTDVVVSEARDGPAKSTFKTTTPKIFIRAKLVDVPAGSKLKGEWIAVKTAVAPPNYKLDSVESVAGTGASRYDGAYSKPSAGWPEGDYRVDLFIDGKRVQQASFKVAK
jgi:hypothetical protein